MSTNKFRTALRILYARTQHELKSDVERINAERDIQRVCLHIESELFPAAPRFHLRDAHPSNPCGCAMCVVLREAHRLDAICEGALTPNYGESMTLNDGSGRQTQALAPMGCRIQSPGVALEMAMERLNKIEGMLDAALHGRLRKRVERHGMSTVLKADKDCRVCADERCRDIDVMLLVDSKSLREVETWTQTTGRVIGRETLRKHAAHQRGA